jgi:nitrite reductase (NADH) small subunit
MSSSSSTLTDWVEIVSVEDIPSLGSRVFQAPAGPIAIFKVENDQIFAVLDQCPHKGGPLSQGIVHGKTVTCPLHAWNIQLGDGCAQAPDQGCVKTFTTQVQNGVVFFMRSELQSYA